VSERMAYVCDKCRRTDRQEPIASVACNVCGARYWRCEKHGGRAGCERSLHSHAALYHPGRPWNEAAR
jgi:hypothetical protein